MLLATRARRLQRIRLTEVPRPAGSRRAIGVLGSVPPGCLTIRPARCAATMTKLYQPGGWPAFSHEQAGLVPAAPTTTDSVRSFPRTPSAGSRKRAANQHLDRASTAECCVHECHAARLPTAYRGANETLETCQRRCYEAACHDGNRGRTLRDPHRPLRSRPGRGPSQPLRHCLCASPKTKGPEPDPAPSRGRVAMCRLSSSRPPVVGVRPLHVPDAQVALEVGRTNDRKCARSHEEQQQD